MDPGLGSSDLGGGNAFLRRLEDFFLSQTGWRGNEKHGSKLEYGNVIRPRISLPDPHVYSIMVIFKQTTMRLSKARRCCTRPRQQGDDNHSTENSSTAF